MILSRRPDIKRFLKEPGGDVRVALIYGRDRGVVSERAQQLAAKIAANPDDPFDVAMLTDSDLDDGKLEGELAALSMMGGRRLVRLRLGDGKAGPEKAAAEALTAHADGAFNPDAFFLIETGELRRDSAGAP